MVRADSFEKILIEAKEKYPMRILAYCLMPNHWHFVLHPKESKDLALFMRWITLTHMTSDYYSWLNQKDKIEAEVLKNLRNSVNKGRPFGSPDWIKKIVKKFKLESTLNLRGRPKKGT